MDIMNLSRHLPSDIVLQILLVYCRSVVRGVLVGEFGQAKEYISVDFFKDFVRTVSSPFKLACVDKYWHALFREFVVAHWSQWKAYHDCLLRHFADSLGELDLGGIMGATGSGLAACTNLTTISLRNYSSYYAVKMISDSSIQHLTKLTSLALPASSQVTSAVIGSLIQLTSLDINSCKYITDDGISRLSNLTSLGLSKNTLITDDCLRRLSPTLTSLDLSRDSSQITDGGLKELTNLISLNLDNNRVISDYGIFPLTRLKSLSLRADIFWNGSSKVFGFALQNLHNLTELGLENNENLTNGDIEHLKNLRSLDLRKNNRITDTVIRKFSNLTSLNLASNAIITDDGVSYLGNLTFLDLTRNEWITTEGIFRSSSSLLTLHLDENSALQDAGVLACVNLTSLELGGRSVSPNLSKLRKLIHLTASTDHTTEVLLLRADLPNLHVKSADFF